MGIIDSDRITSIIIVAIMYWVLWYEKVVAFY